MDLEVDVDHVHVLVSLPLSISPNDAIGLLKSYTSRCLFIELPKLNKINPIESLWSPGKFIGSIGHITLENAKNYIEEHHAKLLGFINGIHA